MNFFPEEDSTSGTDLLKFDFDLPNYDLSGPWGFLNFAGQNGQTDNDWLSGLFECDNSDLPTPINEPFPQGIDSFHANPSILRDPFAQDSSVFAEPRTQQAIPGTAKAGDTPLRSNENKEAYQQSLLELSPQFKRGINSFSSTKDLLYHIPDEVMGEQAAPSSDLHTSNFDSIARFLGAGCPPAPASFAREETSISYSLQNLQNVSYGGDREYQKLPTSQHARNGINLTPSSAPGNFEGQRHVVPGSGIVQIRSSAPKGGISRPPQPLAPSKQAFNHPVDWKPFTDVRQGRIWLVGGQNGQSHPSSQDKTIPRTSEQRRAIANKLRAAFESAQPARSETEFLLLDWTCLELVEEVCLFHAYGPLTKRYLSGMPKHGPAQFDSFLDHINALVAVIGRQDCPKATSLRKRMMDVTHRKRLIDNPWAELGTVEKNEIANRTRKLREEARKAKAAALERENAFLKVQLEDWSSAAPGPDEDGDGALSLSSQRKLITPRRPSKVSSGNRFAVTPQAVRPSPYTPASRNIFSPGASSEQISAIAVTNGQDEYEPTWIDTHGQFAMKKAECTDYTSITRSQTPSPTQRSAAKARRVNGRERLRRPFQTTDNAAPRR